MAVTVVALAPLVLVTMTLPPTFRSSIRAAGRRSMVVWISNCAGGARARVLAGHGANMARMSGIIFNCESGDHADREGLLRGHVLNLDLARLAMDRGNRSQARQEGAEHYFLRGDLDPSSLFSAAGAYLVARRDLADAARDGVAEFHRVGRVAANLGLLRDGDDRVCAPCGVRISTVISLPFCEAAMPEMPRFFQSSFSASLRLTMSREEIRTMRRASAHAVREGHHDAIARENAGHRRPEWPCPDRARPGGICTTSVSVPNGNEHRFAGVGLHTHLETSSS